MTQVAENARFCVTKFMQRVKSQNQLDLAQQHRQSKAQAALYIKSQIDLTIIISASCLLFDLVFAYSALTGGLIATVSNAWFAYKVFRVSPESPPESMLASAYMGEIYKIILTGALFVCAFVLIEPVSAVFLLMTYFVIHMTPALISMAGYKTSNRAGD
jgi:ATP synthase protein I